NVEFIAQRFIPNSFDYRIVVAGDKVLIGYKRIRQQGGERHVNNVARGARPELVGEEELPSEVAKLAIAAAQSIGRELSGVDVLCSDETGSYVVLEANFNFATAVFEQFGEQVVENYYKSLDDYFGMLATR